MAAAEPAHRLLDFIYRDPSRIASLYAQLFGGHLLSAESVTTSRIADEKSSGVSAGLIKGDLKHINDRSDGRKEVITPHDLLLSDLIVRLIADGYVCGDSAGAANGSLIRACGSLSFGDASLMQQAVEIAHSMDALTNELVSSSTGKHQAKKMGQALVDWVKSAAIPSIFQITPGAAPPVAGCLKDDGLQEPIASFYYRHGAFEIPDVQIIGIKELPISSPAGSHSHFMNVTQVIAGVTQKMLFPEHAIRVTPIVIYRELFRHVEK